MKKIIQIDRHAEKEISKFSKKVQIKFRALINILSSEGKLELPDGKKLSNGLFEIRVLFSKNDLSFAICIFRQRSNNYFVSFY